MDEKKASELILSSNGNMANALAGLRNQPRDK
jgi:hypothetical protein